MRFSSFLPLLLLLPGFGFNVSFSENDPTVQASTIVRYSDESGRSHYVEGADKVPEKYKGQLADQLPLPKISKVESSKRADNAPRNPRPAYASSRQEIIVLVTESCPFCRSLEKLLKSKNIQYTRYDIEKSKEGERMYNELGGGGVPITKIGTQIIKGYDPAVILSYLER